MISIADDIVPIAQFKAHASEWFGKLGHEKDTVVITNNGRAAGVLLSPSEYDRLTYTDRFRSAIRAGLDDVSEGRMFTTKQIEKELGL
jgi:prevent-host-death family protein